MARPDRKKLSIQTKSDKFLRVSAVNRKNPLQKKNARRILVLSNYRENQTILIIQKHFPMKQNLDLQAPATGKVLLRRGAGGELPAPCFLRLNRNVVYR